MSDEDEIEDEGVHQEMEKTYRELESLVDYAFVGEVVHVVLEQVLFDAHHCVPHVSDYVKGHEAFVAELSDVICSDVVIQFKKVVVLEVPFVVDENRQRAVCFEDLPLNF